MMQKAIHFGKAGAYRTTLSAHEDDPDSLTCIDRFPYNPTCMNTFRLIRLSVVCAVLCTVGLGCRSTSPDHLPTEPDRVEMLSLMLPDEIKIQPFTKIKSFNDDSIPDGILAIVRPLDRFGDPVKAVGLFYFELYSYQDASGQRKGERIEFWEKTIDSASEVRLHWTRAQMYEFQLAWTKGAGAIQPDRKYLLTVTYRTPWDTTIQDERAIDFHLTSDVLGETPSDGTTTQ